MVSQTVAKARRGRAVTGTEKELKEGELWRGKRGMMFISRSCTMKKSAAGAARRYLLPRGGYTKEIRGRMSSGSALTPV